MFRRRLAFIAVLVGFTAACTGSSPTKATAVTLADFHGQYSGTYSVSSCSADGLFTGFCDGFPSSMTLPIALTVTQTESTVSGTITLGALNGTFQGTVTGGTLSGTATMMEPSDASMSLSVTVANWSTTIA